MSRSLSHLRRGLLGMAFIGSLGFGATAAVAKPELRDPFPLPSCPKGTTPCPNGSCVGPEDSCYWPS